MFYFVPTPIGNIDDVTLRSLKLFRSCEVIICEDPLKTSQLLKLLEIENKPKLVGITKIHDFNTGGVSEILDLVEGGVVKTVVIVSDAGMPGISDPGYLIVKMLQNRGLGYTVLPGANAVLPAVVASGLVVKDFTFLGFLPLKKGRRKALKSLVMSEIPVVLYESNHRIKKLLSELGEFLKSGSEIFIAREISKKFETFYYVKISENSRTNRGDDCVVENKSVSLEELTENIKEKGEFVVVIKNGI